MITGIDSTITLNMAGRQNRESWRVQLNGLTIGRRSSEERCGLVTACTPSVPVFGNWKEDIQKDLVSQSMIYLASSERLQTLSKRSDAHPAGTFDGWRAGAPTPIAQTAARRSM